jgi:hypothetical protein
MIYSFFQTLSVEAPMKKPLILLMVVVVLLGQAFLFAGTSADNENNRQKIHPVDSDVYQAITFLYSSRGIALPSTAGPWSSDELLNMLEKIDRKDLQGGETAAYAYVTEKLQRKERDASFGLDLSLEGYYHTDTENFTREEDWIRGYDERKPILDITLETWPADGFYGYSSLSFGGTRFNEYTAAEGPVSYHFGSQELASNLFFLPPGEVGDLDLGMPYRAFGAFGGEGWSFQVGREQLSWGPGVSGNFILGDHFPYHNTGRFTAYGDTYKYTFATSFFPHPSQYYPIIDGSGNFINNSNQRQSLTGLNMFIGHRLEWRLFQDKVGLALTETIMYQSEDNTIDLRILNPAMIFHNYYIRSDANSIIALEVDYSPITNLNVYAQAAIDEFPLPGEYVPGEDDNAYPNAYGLMVGAKGAYPLKRGFAYGSLEWAKTDPFLYLRDKDDSASSPEDYGISYTAAQREYFSHGIIYNEEFIGYEYGPDAIVINAQGGYKEFGKWFVEGNIFYMLHGTHDIWTVWTRVDTGDPGDDDPTPPVTPTDSHETENNGDLDADERDSVSKTFYISAAGGYAILPELSVYGQVDYLQVENPGNIAANGTIRDVQLTFGITYSL